MLSDRRLRVFLHTRIHLLASKSEWLFIKALRTEVGVVEAGLYLPGHK